MSTIAPSQPLEALALANRVRFKRARLKSRIRETPILAAACVANPPEWLLSMPVEALLKAVPKFGPVKVRKIMRGCEIAPSKTVGGLSGRQRDRLVADLRGRL